MGSLVGGWSSTNDLKAVKYQRNKSLTREAIDAYWESKKQQAAAQQQQQHQLQPSCHEITTTTAVPTTDTQNQQENSHPQSGEEWLINRSTTTPQHGASDGHLMPNVAQCWWNRSNSAFLNRAPVEAMDGPSYKYASQYHLHANTCHQHHCAKESN